MVCLLRVCLRHQNTDFYIDSLNVEVTTLPGSCMASASTLNLPTPYATTCNSEAQLVDSSKASNLSDTVTVTEGDFPGLPYSLRDRKKSIAIVFSLLLLDASFLPLGLFFGLKYGAKLDDQKNIGITTAVFGFFSLLQFGYRIYMLCRKDSNCRPLSTTHPTGHTPRWYFDFYQIQFAIGFAAISGAFVKATTPHPNFALLALPPCLLIAQCAPQFLFSSLCHHLKLRLPFRLSSTEAGEIAPPAVYTIIEDIVAVDGGGGSEFRKAMKRRYGESWRFRRHMQIMTIFWGCSGMFCGGGVLALVLTLSKYAAYAVGWTVPFIWAGIMAYVTIRWTQREMKVEYEDWLAGRWGSRAQGSTA